MRQRQNNLFCTPEAKGHTTVLGDDLIREQSVCRAYQMTLIYEVSRNRL